MNVFLIPQWIIYSILGFFIILMAFIVFLIIVLKKREGCDKALLIDGDNRARLINTEFRGESWKYEGGIYDANYESGITLEKGKRFYIWTFNKPQPVKIISNKITWFNSDTLMATINNEIIKFILKVQEKLEIFIMIGAIAGCVSAVVSIFIFAKVYGILK